MVMLFFCSVLVLPFVSAWLYFAVFCVLSMYMMDCVVAVVVFSRVDHSCLRRFNWPLLVYRAISSNGADASPVVVPHEVVNFRLGLPVAA
eukprot:12921796-Prorocentrum_lima.AAC.1